MEEDRNTGERVDRRTSRRAGEWTSGYITLRAVEPEDLELMYKWENDRTVWYVSNTLVPFSRYQLKQYIESDPGNIYAHHQLRMMIDFHEYPSPSLPQREEVRTIGSIDLFDYDPVNQRAGLGILIASDTDRRQGYAYEALFVMIHYCRTVLFLNQLYCSIAISNRASIRLFRSAGFRRTGTKKEWRRTETGYEDELFLQLKI